MGILGIVAILLPQVTLLMLFAGYLGLLGGWNTSEAGMLTVLWLITLGPILAFAWLVALPISNLLRRRRGRPRQPLWPAIVVLLQAVLVHWLVLSSSHL